MGGAVVAYQKLCRGQRLSQQRLQLAGQATHDLILPLRCSQSIWPIRNRNMVPGRP
jgi:hypothetical protein